MDKPVPIFMILMPAFGALIILISIAIFLIALMRKADNAFVPVPISIGKFNLKPPAVLVILLVGLTFQIPLCYIYYKDLDAVEKDRDEYKSKYLGIKRELNEISRCPLFVNIQLTDSIGDLPIVDNLQCFGETENDLRIEFYLSKGVGDYGLRMVSTTGIQTPHFRAIKLEETLEDRRGRIWVAENPDHTLNLFDYLSSGLKFKEIPHRQISHH